jgi:hypothetical protein
MVPGRDDEERYCRLVIMFARMMLADRPEQADALEAQLREELKQYLETSDEERL